MLLELVDPVSACCGHWALLTRSRRPRSGAQLRQSPRASAPSGSASAVGASLGGGSSAAGPPPRRAGCLLGGGAPRASAAGSSAGGASARRRRRPGPAPRSGPAGSPGREISAFRPRTRPVIGEAIMPTSWPCSTSRAGSFESASIWSTVSASPFIRPPLNASTSCLAAELWPAPSRPGPRRRLGRTNVNAVGPSRNSFSASAPAWSAARSVSVFLTTRKRGAGLDQARRAARPPAARRSRGSRRRRPPRDSWICAGHLLDYRSFLFSVHLSRFPLVKEPARRRARRRRRLSRGSTCPGLTHAQPGVSGRNAVCESGYRGGRSSTMSRVRARVDAHARAHVVVSVIVRR